MRCLLGTRLVLHCHHPRGWPLGVSMQHVARTEAILSGRARQLEATSAYVRQPPARLCYAHDCTGTRNKKTGLARILISYRGNVRAATLGAGTDGVR